MLHLVLFVTVSTSTSSLCPRSVLHFISISFLLFRSVWFEAATVGAIPPTVKAPAGSVLRSALAGGLSCSFSCAVMHPLDTIKVNS